MEDSPPHQSSTGGGGQQQQQRPGGMQHQSGAPPWGSASQLHQSSSSSTSAPPQQRPTTTAAAPWGQGLTEALQSSVNSLVPSDNPAVKSLTMGLEHWHHSLRNEATQRLGGFKPPLQLTDGLNSAATRDDQWDLLKRVRGQQGAGVPPGLGAPGSTSSPHHEHASSAAAAASSGLGLFGALPALSLVSGTMKRAASETSLEAMNNTAAGAGTPGAPGATSSTSASSAARKHSRQAPPSVQPQPAWAWEQAAVGASPWTPAFGGPSMEAYAEAHASAIQAMGRRAPFGLLTSADHKDAGGSPTADAASGSFGVPPPPPNHTYWAPPSHHSRALHVPLPTRPSYFGSPTQHQQQPHLGMPRVPTAPTFQEISETLNNSAHRNLEAVRAALQNAQASIQETASNCQANLQSLSTILQAAGTIGVPGAAGDVSALASGGTLSSGGGNGGGGGGGGGAAANPLQAALSSSRAVVTWTISNAGDPLGGALVPWHQVIPRVISGGPHHRHVQSSPGGSGSGSGAAGPLATVPDGGGGGGDGSQNPRGAMFDFVTPLEQYMNGLASSAAHSRSHPLLFGSGDRDARGERGGSSGQLSLREPGRQVAIVTTASLPWLTGTAVNPLLRAAYLSTDSTRRVTLVLPWLSPADQQRVFPTNVQFDSPEQQEEYVRAWARQRTGLDCNFKIAFYPSRYAAEKGSILPVGDITQVIPDNEADVAVLEEPEHLNWYHHGTRWTDKFKHVVGVMHTNYLDYARREENGNLKEQILKHINAWVTRIHCHKVIKLSDAVQPLPREDTMFVHGVSPAFLRVGAAKAQQAQRRQQALQLPDGAASSTSSPSPSPASAAPSPLPAASTAAAVGASASGTAGAGAAAVEDEPVFRKGVYFLGKVLWAKGYTELLDRLNEHVARTGEQVEVDVFGAGPDLKAVEEEASRRRLALHFNGARDHADESLQDYKVFINPSLSDVVATTTAEALAMGKWVVCADHPSNQFFKRFPNCLIYRDSEEFSQCLSRALHEEPRPLSPTQLHDLTWEAATERFLDVADLSPGGGLAAPLEAGVDKVLHAMHNALTGVEFFRVAMGAGARTRDLPPRVTDYQPDENDVGGFFDNTARAKKSWEGKKPNGGSGKKGKGGKGAGGEGGAAADKLLPSVPEGTAVKA